MYRFQRDCGTEYMIRMDCDYHSQTLHMFVINKFTQQPVDIHTFHDLSPIPLIKYYRQQTGFGLKESKDDVCDFLYNCRRAYNRSCEAEQ